MSNQVAKVNRETISACMTCPLCDRLLRGATTISECLHTFCRRCIRKKLSDEEVECCPVCKIDLGCTPLEKLRADHNLQDVRAKVFPYKRRKVHAPETDTAPSVTLPVRRKERSLSSLVVSTPRVSTQSGMTGRRSKSIARKSLRGAKFSVEKSLKKDEASAEDNPKSPSSPETLHKFTQNIRQISSNGDPSGHPAADKDASNDVKAWEGLNTLVEVAHRTDRTKSSKFPSQGSASKTESLHLADNEGPGRKIKGKEYGQKSKVPDEKNSAETLQPEPERPKKFRRNRPKKSAPPSVEINVSPQHVLDGANAACEKRINPIWFSLVAIKDMVGDASLPQVPASYLRIKDGNITVSFIQRYLTRKLELQNEDEVEIRCMGRPLVPTLPLSDLVESWLQSATSEKMPAIIGSSAKDFVMVLAYSRKMRAS